MQTTKHFRPWFSERSNRWHGLDGRFLSFSDARPRGGVFEIEEGELDFAPSFGIAEVAPAKARQLEARRGRYHGRRGKAVESNTVTGRAAA